MLKINQTPLVNSYWIIPRKLLTGEFPRTKEHITSISRIEEMFRAGITQFIDLTTPEDNLLCYENLLKEVSGGAAQKLSFPIPDLSVPANAQRMVLDLLAGNPK